MLFLPSDIMVQIDCDIHFLCAGDLAAGLEVLELMESHAQLTGDVTIAPDARTYTILISTVARYDTF